MGKVNKLRKKFNLACQKSAVAAKNSDTSVVPVVKSVPGQAELPVKLSNDANVFAGLTISFSGLGQTLLPPASKPRTVPLGTVSEPSVAGSSLKRDLKHVSKKSKIIAKRGALLRKLDTVKQLKDAKNAVLQKEAEEAKRAKKQKVTKAMLMTTLIDALPMLPSSDKGESNSNKEKKIPKVKPCLPKKKRNKQFMDGIKAYKACLGNPHYKADPASAISNYIINTAYGNSTQVQPKAQTQTQKQKPRKK